MKFKFSDKTIIDSEASPWKREGLRVGIYGAPGSTKSYTAAASFIEPFLEQGGTIIMFQPRSEWHTLKAKFPDVQVIGGAYLSDMPFAASHPKLYADAVVEQGISMIFYTPDVDDEEKLINFVDRFLDYVMKAEEVHHRPIMVVLEEGHEYAPLNAKGHIAAPWVFARMVKRLKDLWTSGRKLNIVPVVITQRPQELSFSVRQLCNISLYGQFSPQDISYIDKECLMPYRKQGIQVDAKLLLSLKAGEFLIIEHGNAYMDERTVQRITPHGADTPSLEMVHQASAGVKATVSSLGEQLKALLEAEKVKESETETLKRKLKDSEAKVTDLESKVKLGVDLKSLLSGNSGEDSVKMTKLAEELEHERAANAQRFKGQEELIKTLGDEVQMAQAEASSEKRRADNLLEKLQSYELLGTALRSIIGIDMANDMADIKQSVETMVSEIALKQVAKVTGVSVGDSGLVVDKTEADLEVVVHREKVTAEESTLRGQIAMLIVDGVLNSELTTRTVISKLKESGWPAPEGRVVDELLWYARQHILSHEVKNNGGNYWQVRDKERIRVREA